MANRHTDWPNPEHRGEVNLAKQLCSFSDSRLHLWFGLNALLGVNDIDVLLYHELAGLFVIEVKSVPLKAITVFGWDKCHIVGREPDRGPQNQAWNAKNSLLNLLAPDIPQIRKSWHPTVTACWPKIERRIWNLSWDDPRVVGGYAERMVFSEDLFTDYRAFLDRLLYIRRFPPVGPGTDYLFQHDPALLERLCSRLEVTANPKPTPSDLERLRAIESKVKGEAAKHAPPDRTTRLLYRGGPGTGKTFRLLQVAYSHAMYGKRVLFLCFNKVLAADIKRLLGFGRQHANSAGSIEVFDLFELLSQYAQDEEIRKMVRAHDEWGHMVVSGMKESSDTVRKYDTLLIDEAQDLRPWAFPLIDVLSKPDASLLVSVGSGQELYGEQAEWLADFGAPQTLRRNFRNTEPIFKLSQLFFEAYGKTGNQFEKTIDRFKDKKTLSRSGQLALFTEIERTGGALPSLIAINDLELDDSDFFFADAQQDCMVSEYRRLIENEIESLTDEQRPLDFLILVPGEGSNQRKWAVQALEQIGCPFRDYTVDDNRRSIPEEDMIRLCTYHSSRGIEGHRVLVLGFEIIDRLSDGVNVSANNLGYIVLSRASIDLTLAHRATVKSPPVDFARRSIVEIHKSMREVVG